MATDPTALQAYNLAASVSQLQEGYGISVMKFGASGSVQTTVGSINTAANPRLLTVTDVKDFRVGQYVFVPKAGAPSYKSWKAELNTDPTQDGTFVVTLDGTAYFFPYTIAYETVQVTFTGRATAQNAMILQLDGNEVSVPLMGNETTPELVAARVGETANRNRFLGWTVSVSGPTATFRARRQGRKGTHSFSPNGTGVTATLSVTEPGSGSMEDVMGAIRGSSFPGWTTSGYGPWVVFTSTTTGLRTGIFSFDRSNTGATGSSAMYDEGVSPLITRIEQIQDNTITLRDAAQRTVTDVTVSHDDTAPIQAALDYVQSSGILIRLSGTHNISSTLRGYSRTRLVGDGPHTTVLQTVRNIRLIEFLGSYLNQGPSMTSIQLEDLQLNGNNMGTQGLVIRGGRNVRIDGCRFVNFLDEFVVFDEVFDSTIEKTYFTNGYRHSPSALFLLRYGGPDNTNEIHFTDVVWETMVRPAVRMQSGPTSANQINEIFFNACKWESVYPTTFIEMNGAANVFFNKVNFCLPRSASSRRQAGIYAENCTCIFLTNLIVEYFLDPVPGEIGFEPPFMIGKSTSYTSFVNAMMTGRLPPALFDNITGSTMLTHTGAYIGQDYRRPITAGQTMTKNQLNSNFRVVALGAEPSLELQRVDGDVRWTYFLGRIDPSGTFRIYDGNGRNLFQLMGDTGESQPQYGLRVSEKWNSGNLLRLGNYRLWIDAAGNLRKKNGVPISDTDGTIV